MLDPWYQFIIHSTQLHTSLPHYKVHVAPWSVEVAKAISATHNGENMLRSWANLPPILVSETPAGYPFQMGHRFDLA